MKSFNKLIGIAILSCMAIMIQAQTPIYYGEPGVIYTTGSVILINDDGTGYTAGVVPQMRGLGRSMALDNNLGLLFFTSWTVLDPSTGGGIWVYNTNTGIATQLLNDPTTGIPDIEVDPFSMTVYWTDFTRGEIRSATYDAVGNLGPTNVEISGRSNPFGLAFDGYGGPKTFYWSETTSWTAPGTGGTVYSGTSASVPTAIESGYARIDDVELDVNAGMLYFSNWASGPPNASLAEGIYRVGTDGSGLTQILSGSASTSSHTMYASGMHSIALDPNNQAIYFTRGVSYANQSSNNCTYNGEMSRINYDGTGYVMLNPECTLHFPGGVALGIDPPMPIPTMSQWSLFILGLIMTSLAVVRIRKGVLAMS